MDISAKIYNFTNKNKLMEIGEVKKHRAYLYSKEYEIVIEAITNRKVVRVEILDLKNERELVASATGTINHVLHVAAGYIRNH